MSATIDALQALRIRSPNAYDAIKRNGARERDLSETLRIETARCIERLASAMQTPLVARDELEKAREHYERAKAAADALDPLPEAA